MASPKIHIIRNFWLLALAVIVLNSCVTNRKVQFLQKGDLNVRDSPKDTVMRSYDLPDFDYKIQSNDVLSIRFQSVTKEEFDFLAAVSAQSYGNVNPATVQLTGHLVDPEGFIPFPVVGKVKVAGLNIFQVQDTLQKIATSYVESPVVRVRLLNYRITVLGEVNSEGTLTLGNNRTSFLEAIGLAGGFTDLAVRDNVKLIRQINGKTEVQYLNLLREEFLSSDNYFVYQNDILIVPPLKQRPYRKYFSQNLSLLISSLSLLLLTITFLQK